LPLLDEVAPHAEAVGAVNTVVVRAADGGRILRGENTDINGFLTPLAPYVEDLRARPVLMFGCGGSARAVAYGILNVVRPPLMWIVGRDPAKCEAMLAEILASVPAAPEVRVIPFSEARTAVVESGLIVNCTPLGMHPNVDETPWESADDFNAGHVVYDLVYNPLETRLLRDAASRGARCINGLEMLIQQASASYRLWTGRQMPLEPVREVLSTGSAGTL
ncbi:MAG TPA: shikimate dehydrogenase, partial [Rhodothermales bacterium]